MKQTVSDCKKKILYIETQWKILCEIGDKDSLGNNSYAKTVKTCTLQIIFHRVNKFHMIDCNYNYFRLEKFLFTKFTKNVAIKIYLLYYSVEGQCTV